MRPAAQQYPSRQRDAPSSMTAIADAARLRPAHLAPSPLAPPAAAGMDSTCPAPLSAAFRARCCRPGLLRLRLWGGPALGASSPSVPRRDSPTMHRAPNGQHQPDITRGPPPPNRARPGSAPPPPAPAWGPAPAPAGTARPAQRARTGDAGHRTGVGLDTAKQGPGSVAGTGLLRPGTGTAAQSRALAGRGLVQGSCRHCGHQPWHH